MAKEKLGPVIAFRLSEAQHHKYQAAALAAGVSLSVIVRQCLAESSPQIVVGEGKNSRPLSLAEMERMAAAVAVVKKVKPPKPSQEKTRLLFLFNKASNNLNQLAHAANTAHLAGKATPATYDGILAELQAIADQLHEGLARAE